MQWIKDQCWQDSTDGAVWKKQTSVKYLGATVDNHLRWHAHFDSVQKGCHGKIAAIRRACHYLSSHIKRTLYLSLVLPHLKYCSVVWGNCRTTLSSRLEHVQNYDLRVILNKPPRSNTKEMRSQLSLPPLSSRREATMILQVRRCLSRCARLHKYQIRDKRLHPHQLPPHSRS